MKLNLVIDASGIFYRTLFTVGNYETKKGEKLLDSRKTQGIFMRKLATDLSALVRNIDEPSRVIICLDSSSWRKTIDIEDGGYKASRKEKKEDSPINWTAFFELTDNFAKILSQKGYIISRIPGAEADDLLFFWSRKLNSLGENAILITGDRDLLQCVGKHKNGSWTIALDPVLNRKKISLTQETLKYSSEDTSEASIFDPSSWNSSSDVLDKIVKTHELNIVDTKKFCTMKVVLGDSGDDVPSVVTWRDKKDPEKIRTMTESNYSKILAAAPDLENASWKDLRDGKFVEEISSVMEGLKKIEVDRELVRKNLKRNCLLVILSGECIPGPILDAFRDSLMTPEGIEVIPDTVAVTSRDGILSGSEWWTSDKTDFVPKSFDLFGDE
jgi:5'-3' exonuclease